MTGYEEAVQAIQEGKAIPHALWVLVGKERDRDGYALKPDPWEGPGEYQHVEFDGKSRLIRIPIDKACRWKQALISIYEQRVKPAQKTADKIIALPPITLRQLNTIAAALKLAEVRYGMMLQLPRFEEVPPLSHEELGDLAETLDGLFLEMKGRRHG